MNSKINRIIAFICWFCLGVLGFTACSTASKKAAAKQNAEEGPLEVGTKADTTATAPADSSKLEGEFPRPDHRVRLLYGVPPTRYLEKLPDEVE